jgi:hypothetical protein
MTVKSEQDAICKSLQLWSQPESLATHSDSKRQGSRQAGCRSSRKKSLVSRKYAPFQLQAATAKQTQSAVVLGQDYPSD